MSPRKRNSFVSGDAKPRDPKEVLRDLAPARLARIPSPARFFLVVLSSLVVSSVLFTTTCGITQGDLGLISKHFEEWWEVGGLIAWRAVEVGLAWVLGFDSWDVASFLFLTHLPTYNLLVFFYRVRPTSALVPYAITLVSTVLPFAFLRRPASVHDLSHAPSDAVANRAILQDRLTTIFTSLAATSVSMVVIYISYASWLPAQLVVHFESIPDISAAHAGPAGLPLLFLTLCPAGFAVRDFLFVSSTGHSTAPAEDDSQQASREGEYLIVAVYRKTWARLSTKTQILVSRTLILAAMILLNTIVQVAGTISGVSVKGASVWGLVWAVGAIATGVTFSWIGAGI